MSTDSGRDFASIEDAIEEIRAGRMIVVVDDEDRENEGDFLMAADKATPEAVNFMAKHGRGLICVPMLGDRLRSSADLDDGAGQYRAARDRVHGLRGCPPRGQHAAPRPTTGRSPSARWSTPTARPDDLTRPGHIFPLRAMPGGVLRRAGHTEAAVDLARLAGWSPAGVICEVLNEDGGDGPRCRTCHCRAAARFKCITIKDLIEYRITKEKLVDAPPSRGCPPSTGSSR